MTRTETSAIAVVTLTVSVELSQPWPGEATLVEIQKAARDEARERLAAIAPSLKAQCVRVGDVRSVRIVLNEEKYPFGDGQ